MTTKVKDVMIRDVITVEASTSLIDALQLMLDKTVKSVVIPPKNESDAFAILTFTDIARKVLAEDERLEMLNVFDIMQKPCLLRARRYGHTACCEDPDLHEHIQDGGLRREKAPGHNLPHRHGEMPPRGQVRLRHRVRCERSASGGPKKLEKSGAGTPII